MPPVSLPRSLAIGVVGGLMSGFLGVGGGIIIVPLLIWSFAFDRHKAHATSLAAIFIIAGAAFAGYLGEESVDVHIGLALGAGGVVGSGYGAGLMHRLSPETLRAVFAVALIVAGVRMLL